MKDEYVVGLDVSTQSAKAIAWNKTGSAITEGRALIPMSSPSDGYFEQEPSDWWKAAKTALSELTKQVDASQIVGVAISNQRETVGFLDEAGESQRPGMVWLDYRAVEQVNTLNDLLGEGHIHKISGKPKDVTPVAYRLMWLRENMPDILDKVHLFTDVHGYTSGRLTGNNIASRTSADPFGIFDINKMEWSEEILNAVGLTPKTFPNVMQPAELIGQVSTEAARDTGLSVGTPVYCGGGDGQCAGLGVNAAKEGTVYLNLGTAIITGAWSAEPRINLNWRTMTSPTGNGYFLEGVLRAGTFLVDWFVENLAGGKQDPEIWKQLEKEASWLPIGSEGLIVCPYLAGCMNPHWNMNARASFNGMSAIHTRGHMYRAVLEALTGEIARCIVAMRANDISIDEIVAVGGGAQSALWRQMIADACGLDLTISKSLEATSLGAAMCAAVGAKWYNSFEEAAENMSKNGETTIANAENRPAWDTLLERQNVINTEACRNT
ncbi:MAG: FGGY-family carbohydrate kinase [Hyphomicrobiales bacterium]